MYISLVFLSVIVLNNIRLRVFMYMVVSFNKHVDILENTFHLQKQERGEGAPHVNEH